jgi:hypothetical protein
LAGSSNGGSHLDEILRRACMKGSIDGGFRCCSMYDLMSEHHGGATPQTTP